MSLNTYAQDIPDTLDYRRSSLYSILINHEEQKFAKEIGDVFLEIPIPDKYNNHDLSVKIVSMDKRLRGKEVVDSFIVKNDIASRMVARWFNRDQFTGICDVNLVKERGLYDASEFDKELAARSARGKALLEDAGEDLIGNTFLLVNDIRYRDKEKASKGAGIAFRVLGAIAGGVAGVDLSDATDALANMIESIKGFKVIVNTHLYQLVWDEETSATFYREYYSSTPDSAKVEAFKNNRDKFKMVYIGSQRSDGNSVSVMGVNLEEPEQMVRKACQRAIDENIVSLQKNFDVFKVKTPLISTDPIYAEIGMKEGITTDSRFEVLEVVLDNDKIKYKRVGVIKPVKDKIWDNRYMAVEEGATGANLKYTTFTKVSGNKDFYPGMLIREIK
ncbi:MAG: hypothetical protein IJY36_03265 [Coprobacter sp.]|nr:hypothetical protein [Coprobacter sp.]